jgi:flagellar biosynthesis/type III secretory pathway M-ring protein FliF/YscJ
MNKLWEQWDKLNRNVKLVIVIAVIAAVYWLV